ncbi:MAG: (4Fe-4S)-binding protein [Crocinitomicaceae bacterium]|jgi:uncharacterized Fe-S cluster protein YjdI|nr:(4Fe-4S)-binding protein [Crocinitomicaceae bacterium]|tara:strand:+ start:100466 stop:100672 length:207 start_codon:yes stop_codon:yes gene_type:complete
MAIKKYEKEDIKIVWESEKCIHSANCAKGLASVFKPQEKPWIQPEGATKQAIIDQVIQCPSRALSIER